MTRPTRCTKAYSRAIACSAHAVATTQRIWYGSDYPAKTTTTGSLSQTLETLGPGELDPRVPLAQAQTSSPQVSGALFWDSDLTGA